MRLMRLIPHVIMNVGNEPCKFGSTEYTLSIGHPRAVSMFVCLEHELYSSESRVVPTSNLSLLYPAFHIQTLSTQLFCYNKYLDCNENVCSDQCRH